jgi:hypothetical protein
MIVNTKVQRENYFEGNAGRRKVLENTLENQSSPENPDILVEASPTIYSYCWYP